MHGLESLDESCRQAVRKVIGNAMNHLLDHSPLVLPSLDEGVILGLERGKVKCRYSSMHHYLDILAPAELQL
jgi:hypothetical protein